jgi:hypothetical protein
MSAGQIVRSQAGQSCLDSEFPCLGVKHFMSANRVSEPGVEPDTLPTGPPNHDTGSAVCLAGLDPTSGIGKQEAERSERGDG